MKAPSSRGDPLARRRYAAYLELAVALLSCGCNTYCNVKSVAITATTVLRLASSLKRPDCVDSYRRYYRFRALFLRARRGCAKLPPFVTYSFSFQLLPPMNTSCT